MSKTVRIVIISVSGAVVLVALLVIGFMAYIGYVFGSHTNESDNQDPQKQADMLKCTLEWGRLAPIPDSKTQFQINTEGNMFTRSFRSSFYLPKEDLADWVKASPGLKEYEVKTSGTADYIVEPGGGANSAEVTVDYSTGFVQTYVSWS